MSMQSYDVGKNIVKEFAKRCLCPAQVIKTLEESGNPFARGDTLSLWTNDKRLPTTEFVLALYSAVGVSPDQLLFGENYPRAQSLNERICALNSAQLEKLESDLEGSCVVSDDLCINDYSSRLREIRKALGLRQEEVAKRTGYNRTTVWRNENLNEAQVPKLRYVLNFCNNLRVSADYILCGEFVCFPTEIRGILGGLPFEVQLNLLEKMLPEK